MIRLRPYAPLLGFLVPTLLLGYGLVIPRSCIAGVNELTIGFGTTVLAAAVIYVVGQRAVPTTTPSTAWARALTGPASRPFVQVGPPTPTCARQGALTRLRPYAPLLGFLVPTLLLGYGVLIPRSCIAGVNELSIGFGTTVLGAAVTYIAGQRAVRPPTKSLSAWARALNRQAASPSGLFGRLLGVLWRREHARLNAEVLDRLDLHPGHRVLEIGSGPGDALHEAARRAASGRVVGIDASDVMVRQARRRNPGALVEVRLGDADALALEGETFDRIFSVHCLYFWRDLPATLATLATALGPDGKLVLAFRPDGDDIPARFRDPIYRFPRPGHVEAALRDAGLRDVRAERSSAAPEVLLVTATR